MEKSDINLMNPRLNTAITSGDLNIFYARAISDQQITYVIEFGGTLDLNKLEKSVAELIKTVPILHTVIKAGERHLKRVWQSGNSNIFIADKPDDPQETIVRFISTPCEPEKDMPLKLLVARSGASDTLCVKIDHVVSDAGGLKLLLYLLSDAYTNGEITIPVNQNRSLWQVFRKFSITKIVREALNADMPRPGAPLIRGPFADYEFFIEQITLEPDLFDRLQKKAKASDLTINDLILTAVYCTVFQYPAVQVGVDYPLMVPVDLRRYLNEDERNLVANFSSSLYPALAKIENENFTGTMRRVKGIMNQYKRNMPGLGVAAMMCAGASFGSKRLKAMYKMAAAHESGFINPSNFGVVDKNRLRFDSVPLNRVYGVGPIQNGSGLMIAATTFNGMLNLVAQGYDKQKLQPYTKEFLIKIKMKLTDFAEGNL